ncbi:uncharacterized protein LOC120199783 [Hibiscus syriacus]|uniref:uncharacterized protein LOC120199783 n=1 Tax=Hibiscus syriacus TaxID=106335 RepID=UPI0019234D2D|nr:uncharacterized protein LOC120199783 [Hibiscus syriacus]
MERWKIKLKKNWKFLSMFTGNVGHTTLRIQGFIRGKPINVLIDSGNTHSFVTPKWAKEGVEVVNTQPLTITVANGEKLFSTARSNKVSWKMQGYEFQHDFRVLSLGGSDMVLGVDWMEEFSHILMDFKAKTISFEKDGKAVVIRGTKKLPLIKPITGEKFQKLVEKDTELTGEIYLLNAEVQDNLIPLPLQELLEEFNEVFEEPKGMPHRRQHDHAIVLKQGTQPVNLRPYRFAEMLSSSIIQVSKSPFASPCFLIKKKDGTWRFCVDYRQLNSATVKNKFPIPIVEDLLDELYGATFFLKIDLRSGYWQIRIRDEDIHKTAFRTHQGHYEFKQQVEYLGHLISAKGVATDPAKIKAMQQWPLPKNLKALRGFLGLRGYYNYFLETDASSKGIGVVLSQAGRPITYLSRALGHKHTYLSIYEKEYLAILMAISYWRHYLESGSFVIKTDHEPLKHLLEQKLTTALQKKGLTKLLGLDYTIQYRKGKSNKVADALSKQQIDFSEFLQMGVTLITPTWVNDIEKSYEGDVIAQEKIPILILQPESMEDWKLTKGVLYFKHMIYVGSTRDLRQKIIVAQHDSPQGGHSVPNNAWEVITMDFIEGLPPSTKYNCILLLPQAELWYNTNYHTTLQMTPFEALYGYKPPNLHWSGESRVDAVQSLMQHRDQLNLFLREQLLKASNRMKQMVDKSCTDREFQVGDEVYLKLQPYRHTSLALRKNLKLAARFFGPYKIQKRISQVTYKLDLPPESRLHPVFHVSLLKKKVGQQAFTSINPPEVASDG